MISFGQFRQAIPQMFDQANYPAKRCQTPVSGANSRQASSVGAAPTVFFGGRQSVAPAAPVAEQKRIVADIIRKILASSGTPAETLPGLDPHQAFAEVTAGVEESFRTGIHLPPEQRAVRNAYRHVVQLFSRGITQLLRGGVRISQTTPRSQEEIRQAYFNRFKAIAGEAALADILFKPEGYRAQSQFSSYVKRHFDDVIAESFKREDSLATDALYEYKYFAPLYLQSTLLGLEPDPTAQEYDRLMVRRGEFVSQIMGFESPAPEKVQAAIDEMFAASPATTEDLTQQERYMTRAQGVLKKVFPEYFAAPEQAEDLSRVSFYVLYNAPVAKATVLTQELKKITFDQWFFKAIRTATPEEIIARFDLKHLPANPKALRRYLRDRMKSHG